MRALCITPQAPNSVGLFNLPEPPEADGSILVETLMIGLCGTDEELIAGQYGSAPPNEDRLIIGHESIGRVLQAPSDSDFSVGDLLTGMVRRPDPAPCRYCASGQLDMCCNGLYTERGIKGRHGYASERFRIDPAYAVRVDPTLDTLGVLIEPASILAKAWDHIDRIGGRARSWHPECVLITGAGPIGLLAALMGTQRGLNVHILDHNATGPKPELSQALGAIYHGGEVASLGDLSPDVIIECTGATQVILDMLRRSAPSGVLCLAGISSTGEESRLDLGSINRRIVLDNEAIFGTVSANRRHYEMAMDSLLKADATWLDRLITRRIPIQDWQLAFESNGDDIKVALDFRKDW